MKNKFNDELIANCINELSEYNNERFKIEKEAFNVRIDPASIVGALTGGAVAKRQVGKKLEQRQQQEDLQQVVGGSYYQQVENLAKNLRVTFTPFNVIYSLKDGNRQVNIDSISTEEMDNDMYNAFIRRDTDHFNRLLLTKVNTEIQLAEQMFARRMLERQFDLQSQVKQASENNFTFDNYLTGLVTSKIVFEKNADSKLKDYFYKLADEMEEEVIPINLDNIRPLTKYANPLKSIVKFFGVDLDRNNIGEFQRNMHKPSYLRRNLRVGFLPDRVVYIVDGNLVSQIPVMNMNEEGFESFRQNNADYFREMFAKEMGNRVEDMGNFNKGSIDKIASDEKATLFTKSGIHPKTYFIELNDKFGSDWIDFDPEVLIKEIEERYSLEEGIKDNPLNKVLCIQLLNKSIEPLINRHVFEKCVRAFNDKPIDFLLRENNLDLGEIIFTLKVMQEVTPLNDVFDNMSTEVLDYIAETLVVNNYRYVEPNYFTGSDVEKEFYTLLNEEVLSLWNDLVADRITDSKEEKEIAKENKQIQKAIKNSLGSISDIGGLGAVNKAKEKGKEIAKKQNLPEYAIPVIEQNIDDNVAVGVYLYYKDGEISE